MMRQTPPVSFSHLLVASLALLAFSELAAGADRDSQPTPAQYRLFPRDLVRVSVYGEPDLAQIDRRIDGRGQVSLPLVGLVKLGGLTITAAEECVRHIYIEREIFIHPHVSVSVVEYSPKDISVVGQVVTPGKISFPIETDSLDLIDVIGKAGGITRLGRYEGVRVTRQIADGTEQSFSVDVRRMANGRGETESFRVLPGDIVYVPERTF